MKARNDGNAWHKIWPNFAASCVQLIQLSSFLAFFDFAQASQASLKWTTAGAVRDLYMGH